MAWLLTCSLSLSSFTGSALKRELNFCNGYLSICFIFVSSCSGAKTESLILWNLQISTVAFMNDSFLLKFGNGPKLMAIFLFAIGFGPKPKSCFGH